MACIVACRRRRSSTRRRKLKLRAGSAQVTCVTVAHVDVVTVPRPNHRLRASKGTPRLFQSVLSRPFRKRPAGSQSSSHALELGQNKAFYASVQACSLLNHALPSPQHTYLPPVSPVIDLYTPQSGKSEGARVRRSCQQGEWEQWVWWKECGAGVVWRSGSGRVHRPRVK